MTHTDLCCPISNHPCRHAGYNYQVVRTERQKKVKSILGTRLLPDTPSIDLVQDERGVYCNDEQRYVKDMQA